jgi:arylsulfatase A-like enzyme
MDEGIGNITKLLESEGMWTEENPTIIIFTDENGAPTKECTSHVTRHTSHVARHTSHVTRHTSHVTRHTSHVTRIARLLCGDENMERVVCNIYAVMMAARVKRQTAESQY